MNRVSGHYINFPFVGAHMCNKDCQWSPACTCNQPNGETPVWAESVWAAPLKSPAAPWALFNHPLLSVFGSKLVVLFVCFYLFWVWVHYGCPIRIFPSALYEMKQNLRHSLNTRFLRLNQKQNKVTQCGGAETRLVRVLCFFVFLGLMLFPTVCKASTWVHTGHLPQMSFVCVCGCVSWTNTTKQSTLGCTEQTRGVRAHVPKQTTVKPCLVVFSLRFFFFFPFPLCHSHLKQGLNPTESP